MTIQVVDSDFVVEHMDDLPMLDVRPYQLFEAGRIPNTMNVDLLAIEAEGGDWEERFVEAVQELGLTPDEEIIVLCLIGEQAERACRILDEHGYSSLDFYKDSFFVWIQDSSRPVIEDYGSDDEDL